jgi:hypothetical protein
VDE